MSTILSAGTTTSGAALSSDTSGILQLQSGSTPTTAVTIDTAQNVGVGVTPSAWSLGHAIETTYAGHGIWGNAQNEQILMCNAYYNSGWKYAANSQYATQYSQRDGAHIFYNAPQGGGSAIGTAITWTQAMTLTNSGNLLVGTTSNGIASSCRSTFYSDGSSSMACSTFVNQSGASSGTPVSYYYHGAASGGTTATQIAFTNGSAITVGTITSNGTATAFNTSSDRRLKTNIVDLTNSGTIIDSLKPRSFTWISDNSADAGFIADEFQQVLPKAVTGQPNANKEEEYEVTPAVKDSMGNITTPAVMGTRTVPVYQMIDASQPELIAYLVAEVQSLRARLKAANIA